MEECRKAIYPLSSYPKASFDEGEFTRRNNLLLMTILWSLVALMGIMYIYTDSYDNDVWFFLATGREIVEEGIPYANPFSIHEGLGIVVQQWLLCVIEYWIYSLGGFPALGIFVIVLYALLAASLYLVARRLRHNSYGGEVIVAIILFALFAMRNYMSVRPHLITMCAFVWVAYLCEAYRQSGNWRLLIAIPFICALHVNFHAAMAPYDIAIVCAYMIPNFLKPLHERGRICGMDCIAWDYRRLPLLVCALCSCVALLANPYLLNGALYLVNSFGSASYAYYISEMLPFAPLNYMFGATTLAFIGVVAIAIGRRGMRRIDFPLLAIFFVNVCLAFSQTRNYWLPVLFGAIYLFKVTASASWTSPARIFANKGICAAIFALFALPCALFFANGYIGLSSEPQNCKYTPTAAMDYLQEQGVDASEVRAFAFFNAGGYLEWRGYKVNMDPRPELWGQSITGAEKDYYTEYIDAVTGKIYFEEYAQLYGFNVYVVPSDEPAVEALEADDSLEQLPSGEDYMAYASKDLLAGASRR